MTALQLDWSTAEVSHDRLTVGFSDRTPKEWREAFARAAALLGQGTWHVDSVKRRSVRISPVRIGEEERVKHFLESAVFEANATIMSEDELFDPGSADEDAEHDEHDAETSPDEELTARFRAFS